LLGGTEHLHELLMLSPFLRSKSPCRCFHNRIFLRFHGAKIHNFPDIRIKNCQFSIINCQLTKNIRLSRYVRSTYGRLACQEGTLQRSFSQICRPNGKSGMGLFHTFHHVTEKGFANIFHVGLVVDVEQL
jgi:hypothetical protein